MAKYFFCSYSHLYCIWYGSSSVTACCNEQAGKLYRLQAKKGSALPPLGYFADISSNIEENFKLHLLNDFAFCAPGC